jgi:hypothetical protein
MSKGSTLGREVEMTFVVPLSEVGRIYGTFTGPKLMYPDRSFEVVAKQSRTVLHFYLAAIEGISTRRLRVKRCREMLMITLESKRVLSDDALRIEKEERTENPDLPLPHVADMLTTGTPVISSFIKNQYRFKLKAKSGSLKVSLDQVLPFQADDPALLGPQFWHLEIEEANSWSLSEFRETGFFERYLAPLEPLTESKWKSARMSCPVRITYWAKENLSEYFDELLAVGGGTLAAPEGFW